MPVMEQLLNAFRVNIIKTGNTPFDTNKRSDWIEIAQHYGVPTPCIDFTYSPFVATFFAFNGMEAPVDPNSETVVYALDKDQLAFEWALLNQSNYERKNPGKNPIHDLVKEFLTVTENLFEDGFPESTIKFIHSPSSFNTRMQRQQGCFIYCNYDFEVIGWQDFEAFLDAMKEHAMGPTTVEVLTKLYIKKVFTEEVFNYLESMNINASMLYLDNTGAAMDVRNSRFYNAMAMNFRDVSFD